MGEGLGQQDERQNRAGIAGLGKALESADLRPGGGFYSGAELRWVSVHCQHRRHRRAARKRGSPRHRRDGRGKEERCARRGLVAKAAREALPLMVCPNLKAAELLCAG